MENVWQTWDGLGGCWYSVFGTAGSGPGTNTVPLATLIAATPNATIINSSPSGMGGVRFVIGFGDGAWDNHVGHADAVRIASAANDTTFDFDVSLQSLPVAVNQSANLALGDSLPTPSATPTRPGRPSSRSTSAVRTTCR